MAMPAAQMNLLKGFVGECKKNPDILHAPELDFYKEWLESLGATIPPHPAEETAAPPQPEPTPKPVPKPKKETPPASESSESDDEPEEELNINLEFVTGPEAEPVPELPASDKEISEEDMDAANDKRSEAMRAMSDGELEQAAQAFSEAISLNPGMSIFYAKRAQLFVRMKRPNAAIQDCTRALELNSDSALAYKQRGRAERLLGELERAYKDLGEGLKIDYDDDTKELQKSMEEDVKKIQLHEHKKEQREKEKAIKRRKKEAAKRKEAAQKAYKDSQASGASSGFPGGMGGMPGGMGGMPGGMGGMPGGMGGMPGGMGGLFSDPEIMELFSDPEVADALAEIQSNPANISKHLSNPKVLAALQKLQQKTGMGGMPGGMGGMPGGMGGMPGGMGGMPGGMGGMPGGMGGMPGGMGGMPGGMGGMGGGMAGGFPGSTASSGGAGTATGESSQPKPPPSQPSSANDLD